MEPAFGGELTGDHLSLLLGKDLQVSAGRREICALLVLRTRQNRHIHSGREEDAAWHAFVEGMELLEKKFGTLHVPWGKINVVVRNGVFPMDGTNVELFGVLHPDEGPEQADGRILCNNAWVHDDRRGGRCGTHKAKAGLEPATVRRIETHGSAALQRLGEAA